MMMELFEGSLSVKAVIQAKKRPVDEVIIDQDKHDRDTGFIIAKAHEAGIKVTKAKRERIDELSSGKTHGGILCQAGPRINDPLEQLMTGNFLCILEGIEDPFNFGYCLRSLMAAGCDGVIVGARNWLDSAMTVAKSSTGASEYLNIHVSENLETTLQQLRQKYVILCAARNDAVSMYDYHFDQPLVLAVGGERRGLSKTVLDSSTQNIYIPYNSHFRNALNACSAVSVLAFEIMRQQSGKR